eukprot:CAMPEP_0117671600 /NCGR_PEP_ID=MMETSP0804-20121206/13427_1 /TAXON_ID=1074897 /ORGANISM="Tetraselmis astigmatica, Strain CCMP880" /LENGTH=187 /DNA_ID=CAMNT_0005480085 /DNA_START=117 /DNA_END=683 /DNA_ORIENTATION=+
MPPGRSRVLHGRCGAIVLLLQLASLPSCSTAADWEFGSEECAWIVRHFFCPSSSFEPCSFALDEGGVTTEGGEIAVDFVAGFTKQGLPGISIGGGWRKTFKEWSTTSMQFSLNPGGRFCDLYHLDADNGCRLHLAMEGQNCTRTPSCEGGLLQWAVNNCSSARPAKRISGLLLVAGAVLGHAFVAFS